MRAEPIIAGRIAAQDENLANRAYREIEEKIVMLDLPPGEFLSENRLSKHFNIGRTPVREALQLLAREGLVTIHPRRGVLVTQIDVRAQIELLSTRREVERHMTRLAAQRATKSESTLFAAIADKMRATIQENDSITFMRLDREFNHLLQNACGNEYAVQSMRLMQGLSRRFWYRHYKQVLDLPQCATLHADVSSLIAEYNEKKAAGALDCLIDYLEQFTHASIGIQQHRSSLYNGRQRFR